MCVCVSYSSPPSHIYREEPKGLHMENVAGEALGTNLGKLSGSRIRRLEVGGGPKSRPTTLVGRLVGPTPGHCPWQGRFLVGPLGLATCLSFSHVGFLALVGPLIHVTTCVSVRFVKKLYLGS